MNSTLYALIAVGCLTMCTTALADDLIEPAPLPTPSAGESVQQSGAPSGTYIIPHDGKWNRGMILNDGAQLSGAAPYSAPYNGGAWEGGAHTRFPYFSYRRSWDYAGPASVNVTIVW